MNPILLDKTRAVTRPVHSFLMLGQSNMAGRGALDEAPPIKNERLFMLRNGRWQPLSEPVNYDRPFAGVSLAVSFADEYARAFDTAVGLIPCADGGSSLADWRPGGPLYDHAVFQCGLAGRISEVKGILWHQGEADSGSEEDAAAYEERFCALIAALRKDCGLSRVPLVIGELGAFLAALPEGCRCFREVNAALARIAARTPRCALASAAGLVSKGDNLHFDSRSLRELGRRYFAAFDTIRIKPRSLCAGSGGSAAPEGCR
ncbi:MAG: sialate O-acetylesterase [Treponema sp.]|jgi:hypothetical protein|nr:sialate O-acetylesterase [Treponema sp.]